MKKAVMAVILTAVLGINVPQALAAPPSSVVGAGSGVLPAGFGPLAGDRLHVSLSAGASTPAHFHILHEGKDGGIKAELTGTIDCMTVSGATAYVTGTITQGRETEAPGREATDGAPADARLDGLRILVVEDELDTSRMLAQSLGDRGADVIPVETAAAAAAAVDQGTIHVIVSDIGLPGEDGYELIRRVRSAQTADRVPAIALTAFAQAEDIRRAIEAGFDVHLAKPIDPAELARTILRLSQTATERGARRGNAS